MRIETEIRRSSTVEQHFVHGKWKIIRIYVRGVLREIVVKRRENYHP